MLAARRWFVAHYTPKPDAKYRYVDAYTMVYTYMHICVYLHVFVVWFCPHISLLSQQPPLTTQKYRSPITPLQKSIPQSNSMLCLAWAGGNSSVYKTWRLPDVEILAVELPGRNAYVYHICIDCVCLFLLTWYI